ncbi:flavodoxin domain-containing protein [Candidatus Poseidoniales archaeon]|jgi:succinate dehydrogenase/fumarate reductase-like Fe-S protein/flavodoxin|nr:flavodoxin domain-containing protein [Candidatus Poseidoniales archaeon]
MTIVAKVWIDEDCITCDACQDICPEVFEVNDDSSQILAAVRTDGKFDRNVGGSPMVGSLGADYGEMILEAAEACPVEVIKFELVSDGAEIAVEVAPAAELAVEAAPAAAVATGGSEAFQSLMGGDRSLAIFFGSQTGNAAGLAEKTAKMAADYGLVPTVYDMDGFDASKLNSHPRTLIITSTWGEGEMPDNAETLWNTVSSGKPSLANVHFSVCAIGDSSYDEFCKAGTDWDDKYVELGASRIHEIQLCDVDFDTPYSQWISQALPLLACVDESGTLQEVLLDEMLEYGSGTADEVADGDFAPGVVVKQDLSITLSLFRYCPSANESGWDTIACAVPGHATVEDLLVAIQQDVDGSFAFRRGSGNGTPTSGVRVNGRVVLADLANISDLVGEGGQLKVEPLPGYPVIRDLIVDYSAFESNRSKSKPWLRADPREGATLLNGSPMGTMDSPTAATLHAMTDVSSYQLLHAMSDTVPFNATYQGPAVLLQHWTRSLDPRTGDEQRASLVKMLDDEDGVWAEADMASIARYGAEGRTASKALNSARSHLLNTTNYTGPHGRLVKWYGRSVKWSGNVNETTLYRQVLGPVGLLSNIFDGVSARMFLGFTRTGAPPIRSLQALVAPPAGVGKIPNMINRKVEAHHEVVSLFNEIDQRF